MSFSAITGKLAIKDITVHDGFFVNEDATLKESIDRMNKNGKGVVVLLKGKKPIGIFTERDVVRTLYNGISMREKTVDYAQKTIITVKENRNLLFALNIMIDNNIRRIVVVDGKGNFKGIVNQEDLIKYLEKDLSKENLKVFHIFASFRNLITVKENASLKETMGAMVKNNISSVIVVNKREVSQGIITERDILKLSAKRIDLKEPVLKYMSSPVYAVKLDSDLKDVIKLLNTKGIRRVVIEDNSGKPVGIITERDILRNIEGSYSKFLEDRLKSAKDMLNFLPEAIIDVVSVGREKVIQWCNTKAREEFGDNLIDKTITSLIPKEHWLTIYEQLSRNNRIEKNQIKIDDKYFEISGYFLKYLDKSAMQLILKDITFQVKLSIRDHLTNLYNRRYMEEFLKNELEASRRYNYAFSVVMIDLDDFKKINDTYGHEAGDEVLRAVSEIMRLNMRKADVIGRYGGEEFLIMMPKTAKKNAFSCMEKIKNLINARVFRFNGKDVRITASFGIASYPEDSSDIQDLLAISDIRLYRAKRQGKNRIEVE
ncbi:MAG: hypothetical protein OHK0040_11730 [bacterium]